MFLINFNYKSFCVFHYDRVEYMQVISIFAFNLIIVICWRFSTQATRTCGLTKQCFDIGT